MPTVPLYGGRQVSARAELQQPINVQATPGAFGAGIGQGLQQVGQGMGQAADALGQLQAFDDAQRAKDADTEFANWSRERMYGDGGFMTLEGRAAVDARAAFEREAEEKRKEFGKNLVGGAAQEYARASQSRVQSMFQTSIVHAANARKQWFNDATAARLDTFAEDAVAAYNDPKKVDFNIAAGQAEIRQQAQMLGWDDATRQNREKEFISSTRLNTALRLMEDDPTKAKAYYDQHKDQFTGPHQYQFDKAIEVPLTQENVLRHTDGFFTGDAATDSAAVLREFEGYRSTPYWDVNAYRTGYGSDTITRPDGSVVAVQPGMQITRADAERDLKRRLTREFIPRVVGQVGNAAWAAMPAPARAALASIAYNYGSLPASVVQAVRTGSTEAIATAITGLQGDNEGINKDRRLREAEIVRGMTGVPMEAAAAVPSLGQIEGYLSTIENPTEREMTRESIYARIDLQQKSVQAQQEAVKTQAYNLIETGNINPFDLPADIKVAIGMDGMSSLMTYWEKRSSGSAIETDAVTWHDLQVMAATNPQQFKEIDLFDYKGVLSDTDWKAAEKLKIDALNDDRLAREKGVEITSAMSQAAPMLDAVGLTTTGMSSRDRTGDKGREIERRRAQFMNSLLLELDRAKTANNGVAPNQQQTQQIINRLMLPMVLKQEGGGWFGRTSETEGFAFEMPGFGEVSPGVTVEMAYKVEDIPPADLAVIQAALAEEYGRQPSEEEVIAYYEQFQMQRLGVGN